MIPPYTSISYTSIILWKEGYTSILLSLVTVVIVVVEIENDFSLSRDVAKPSDHVVMWLYW